MKDVTLPCCLRSLRSWSRCGWSARRLVRTSLDGTSWFMNVVLDTSQCGSCSYSRGHVEQLTGDTAVVIEVVAVRQKNKKSTVWPVNRTRMASHSQVCRSWHSHCRSCNSLASDCLAIAPVSPSLCTVALVYKKLKACPFHRGRLPAQW